MKGTSYPPYLNDVANILRIENTTASYFTALTLLGEAMDHYPSPAGQLKEMVDQVIEAASGLQATLATLARGMLKYAGDNFKATEVRDFWDGPKEPRFPE